MEQLTGVGSALQNCCWKLSRETGLRCAGWRYGRGRRSSQRAPGAHQTCSQTPRSPLLSPCCTPQRKTPAGNRDAKGRLGTTPQLANTTGLRIQATPGTGQHERPLLSTTAPTWLPVFLGKREVWGGGGFLSQGLCAARCPTVSALLK